MNTFDAVVFGAALCTLAGFWIRHEVLNHQRRKDAREMLAALNAGALSPNDAREVRQSITTVSRKHGMSEGGMTREQHERMRDLFGRAGISLALLLCAGAAWGQEVTLKEIMPDSGRLNIVRIGANGGGTRLVMGPEWRPPQPGPLCGQRLSTPQTALVEIACPDFDALAKLGVPAAGLQMQVLIHAKYGDAVRVEAFYIDFEGREASIVRFLDLTRDSWGRLIAMPEFPGWKYTRIKINVKRDVD